jgi:hypothetical protein
VSDLETAEREWWFFARDEQYADVVGITGAKCFVEISAYAKALKRIEELEDLLANERQISKMLEDALKDIVVKMASANLQGKWLNEAMAALSEVQKLRGEK